MIFGYTKIVPPNLSTEGIIIINLTILVRCSSNIAVIFLQNLYIFIHPFSLVNLRTPSLQNSFRATLILPLDVLSTRF